MATYRVGWHVNGQGGHRGALGEYLAQLSAAGLQPVINAVDDAGMAVEAVSHGGIVVYRKTAWSGAPDYNLAPDIAALERWQIIESMIPPEIEAIKDKLYIEPTNEPEKTHSDWIGRFMRYLSVIANADGYRIAGLSWATGNPEYGDWETPGMLDYLRYVAARPDDNIISLHEYSLDADDIKTAYPWLVGRYQFLFDVCAEHGIAEPPIVITEAGWTYNDMPDMPMTDIDWLAREYGEIPFCLWTLGSGQQWGSLPERLSAYVDDVTRWVLDNSEPQDEPEPPELWYKSIVVLLPQDATLEEKTRVLAETHANRRTLTQSHDEALQLRQLGQPGSYTIIYDAHRWPETERAMLTAGEHELRYLTQPPATSFEPEPPIRDIPMFITSGFRTRRVYNGVVFEHEGIDLRAVDGAGNRVPIYAVAPGTVDQLRRSDPGTGYGIYVRVRHDVGSETFYTWYCHLNSIASSISIGVNVKTGQLLGVSGNSGNSTGIHLHFNIEWVGNGVAGNFINGDWIDPTPFFEYGDIPLPPDYVDVLPYIKGDGTLYEVRHASGNQERFQTQAGAGNVFYLTKNHGWEQFIYDDSYIWRGKDTTPGPAPDYAERPGAQRYYIQREPGYERARWCRRYMDVGVTYVGPEHHVQFYYKDNCVESAANSGNARNAITLTGKFANRTWNGITVQDVISMSNGTETWYFARGLGMVGWHSPWGNSFISEIHAPGSRPDNVKESGCFS